MRRSGHNVVPCKAEVPLQRVILVPLMVQVLRAVVSPSVGLEADNLPLLPGAGVTSAARGVLQADADQDLRDASRGSGSGFVTVQLLAARSVAEQKLSSDLPCVAGANDSGAVAVHRVDEIGLSDRAGGVLSSNDARGCDGYGIKNATSLISVGHKVSLDSGQGSGAATGMGIEAIVGIVILITCLVCCCCCCWCCSRRKSKANKDEGRYIPEVLHVMNCKGHDGKYRIVPGEMPNGQPLWKKVGAAQEWIYCGEGGQWFIADEDEKKCGWACDTGHAASVERHFNMGEDGVGRVRMPDQIGTGGWLVYDGDHWVTSLDMNITSETCNVAAQEALKAQLNAHKKEKAREENSDMYEVCECGGVFGSSTASFCQVCGARRRAKRASQAPLEILQCVCGVNFLPGAKFCRTCGQTRPEGTTNAPVGANWICKHCGSRALHTSKFCKQCGTKKPEEKPDLGDDEDDEDSEGSKAPAQASDAIANRIPQTIPEGNNEAEASKT
eukprot:TRINITY_DN43930_c0_g1_i1.p1 TRINITY_DN43930_c0_g1~~TRINITY_DN43930_c0_g1_i1.p1  ORF type:complete len:499 (+),score=83.25 TRINITY_DN43930_c0_g1_i1:83-1579(+)